MPDVEDAASIIPKQEDFHEASPASSIDSNGELDAEVETEETVNLLPAIPQKRKGGRKPIYATSEERKQRNRQAQAAFRERRTEYIKQLEGNIKQQEDSLQTLQQSHRTAADECLMLRYKNSLLERILVEKGIDVQAELRRKEISPPTRIPPNLPHPSPISRSNARSRHASKVTSPVAPIQQQQQQQQPYQQPQKRIQSPSSISTHSSQMSSPMKSPSFAAPMGMNYQHSAYQSPQSNPSVQSRTGMIRSSLKPMASVPAPVANSGQWSSPFQSHNEQLEQEYGSNADMIDVDEEEEDHQPDPISYPHSYAHQAYSMGPPGYIMPVTSSDEAGRQNLYGDRTYNSSQTMLDADPFGLSASMHFPTPFTYQESAMRK